jgi:hypothetical protein
MSFCNTASRSVQRPPGAEVQPRTEQTKQVLSLSPLFNWEDRRAVIDEIAAEKGTETTVKITLMVVRQVLDLGG